MKKIILGILIALLPVSLKAEDMTFPKLTGRVVDVANEIPDDQEAILEKELADFEKATKHQFVVVTIPDLKGHDVDEYTNKLGRHWGIGRASVDDGIILLQSPGDGKPGSGKIRIDVGYGMEYILTDVETGRIIRNTMIPILKQDRPREETTPEALIAGAREIMRLGAITPEQLAENARLEREANAKRTAAVKDFFATLGLIVLGIITVAGIGISTWLFATRKQRAALKAKQRLEAQERERRLAEQRERDRIEYEKREQEKRDQIAAEKRAHAAMLAAMTPLQRAEYDAAQARKRQADLEAAERRRKIAREQEERENNRRRQQEIERKARQRREEEENRSSSYSYGSGSSWGTSDSSSSSSSDSFSGGGGDFGGGGSSDSY